MAASSTSGGEDPSVKVPENAAVFATGGGGVALENQASARLLRSLLTGRSVSGLPISGTIELNFKARTRGWFLDVIVVAPNTPSHQGISALDDVASEASAVTFHEGGRSQLTPLEL